MVGFANGTNDENINSFNNSAKRRRESVSILKNTTTQNNNQHAQQAKFRQSTRLSTNKRVSFGVIHLREFDGHENQTVDLATRQMFKNTHDDSNEHIDTNTSNDNNIDTSDTYNSDDDITFNHQDNETPIQYIPDPVYDDDTGELTITASHTLSIASPITSATPSHHVDVKFMSPPINSKSNNQPIAEVSLMELLKQWKNTQSPAVVKHRTKPNIVQHNIATVDNNDGDEMELTSELQGGIVSRRISTMPVSSTHNIAANNIDPTARRTTMDITQVYGGIVSTSDQTDYITFQHEPVPTIQQEYTRVFGTQLQHNDNTADMSLTRAYGNIVPSTPSIQSMTAYSDAAVAARLTQSANRYPKSPGSIMTAMSLMSPPTVSGHHHIKSVNTDTQPITFSLPSPTPSAQVNNIINATAQQQPFDKSNKITRSPLKSITHALADSTDDMDLTSNIGSILSRRISTFPAAPQSVSNNQHRVNAMELTASIPTILHTITDDTLPVFTSPNSDKRRESRLSRRYSALPLGDVTGRLRDRMQHILNGSIADKTIDLPQREQMSDQTKHVAELMERVLNGEHDISELHTVLQSNSSHTDSTSSGSDQTSDNAADDEMELTSELQGGIVSRRISTMPVSSYTQSHARHVSEAEESEAEMDAVDMEQHINQLKDMTVQTLYKSDAPTLNPYALNPANATSNSTSNTGTTHSVDIKSNVGAGVTRLKFSDFIHQTGIGALDERSESYAQEKLRRRDSSVNQVGDYTDHTRQYIWPPTTLNELIEIACCEGTEVENIQNSCLILLDTCDDLKLNIDQLIDFVDNSNSALFTQLQSATQDQLPSIRRSVTQLRSYCKSQAKLSWYQWRMDVSRQYQQAVDNHYNAVNKDKIALDTLYTMINTVKSNAELLIDIDQCSKRIELLDNVRQLKQLKIEQSAAEQSDNDIDVLIAQCEADELSLQTQIQQLQHSASNSLHSTAQLSAVEEQLCIQSSLLNQCSIVQHNDNEIHITWMNLFQLHIQLSAANKLISTPTLSTIKSDNPFNTLFLSQLIQFSHIQSHLQQCTDFDSINPLIQYLHIELSRCCDVLREIALLKKHYTVRCYVVDEIGFVEVTFTSLSTMTQCIVSFIVDASYPNTALLLNTDTIHTITINNQKPRFTHDRLLSTAESITGAGRLTNICQKINTIVSS